MVAPADSWIFDQDPWPYRLDWGLPGARFAAERGDILVIVDVLSFSSTTVAALHHGATIYPYPMRDGAEEFAERVGAVLRHGDSVPKGSRALSPLSFTAADRGCAYVLCSPNGATCARVGGQDTIVLAGCLLNASAVAGAVERLRHATGKPVTLIACGELWPSDASGDGTRPLRPCIEDYLGAGAILSAIDGDRSPEAQVCASAYHESRSHLADLLWDCASGRELRHRGFGEDARYSARVDASAVVPRLAAERFEPAAGTSSLLNL